MKKSIQTMQTRFAQRLMSAALVSATIALTGCAAFAPATPEKIVEKRAADYWQARLKGKADQAYALSTPSYRQLRTFDQFASQTGIAPGVSKAEVAKVTCEATKCVAQMKISVNPAMLRIKADNIYTYLDETWLLEDGQWWHYQEP